MNRNYRVGEIVLLEWHGWLEAFRVVGVHSALEGDTETVEYQLQMLGPQWVKPDA